jgi:hypothetical protein
VTWARLALRVHEIRAQLYEARAAAELSLMARGVYLWAARESRRAVEVAGGCTGNVTA